MRVTRLLIATVLGMGLAAAVMQGLATAATPSASPPEDVVAAQPVLSATIYPSKDNTLYESPDGAVSSGAGTWLFVGRVGAMQPENTARRGIIAFRIFPTLLPGSTVLTASLRLTLSKIPTQTPVPQVVGWHRATADWGEGASIGLGAGAPATAGDATWLHRFYSGTVWSTLGGDFVTTASVTTTVGALGVYTWTTTPGLVADVQSWVNAPQTNFGWVLKGDELTSFTARQFYAREVGDPHNQPALIVEYTLPPYSAYLPLVYKQSP